MQEQLQTFATWFANLNKQKIDTKPSTSKNKNKIIQASLVSFKFTTQLL